MVRAHVAFAQLGGSRMKLDDIKVCILRIEGTNCEEEAFNAFRSLGSSPEKIHLKQLTGNAPMEIEKGPGRLPGPNAAWRVLCRGLCQSGRHLRREDQKSSVGRDRELHRVGQTGARGLNGFQILVELGVLPAFDDIISQEPQAALSTNISGRFECRPTWLKHENHGKCVFTSLLPRGETVMFPSAHAEGNLRFPAEREEEFLARLEDNDQIVFRYVNPDGNYAGYPWNPNGAISNIAGICNPDGNVLGLMPHPERVMYRYMHPDWTRSGHDPSGPGDGRVVFRSVLEYVEKKF